MLTKFLLTILFATGLDAEGWAKVEQPSPQQVEESEPGLWVAFGKEMRGEHILVRFPEEPTYRYLDEEKEELEAVAAANGVQYRLQILKKDSPHKPAEERGEKAYFEADFWVSEKWVETGANLCFFQTKTPSNQVDFHRQFLASFDVEIRPE